LGVEGWGLGVEGWGLGVEGWGLGVEGWGLRVEGLGLRVEGLGLRVEGWGLRVEGWGLRVEDWGLGVGGLENLADDSRDGRVLLFNSTGRSTSTVWPLLFTCEFANLRFFTLFVRVCSEEIGAGKCRRMADLICAFPVALEQHLLGFQVGQPPKISRQFRAGV
jgi:hypothetical protein